MDIQDIIDKHLRKRSFLSYFLLPVSGIYGLVQRVRRMLYDAKLFKSYNSKIKIISVGNIVSGGAGKTPFTIFLAKLLADAGKNVAVSHRGYKGEFEDSNKIISNNNEVLYCAKNAGDEPYLLAQKLPGIPVVVGRNRVASIKMIEADFPQTDYLILDDSFQHLKIKHDYDFLVFNSGFGLGNGFTLPSGLLREFPSAMKKATKLIWNQLDGNHVPAALLNSGVETIKFSYKATKLYDSNDNDVILSELNKGKNALLSGIGYPKGFEMSCRDYGIDFEKHYKLPDHYNYNDTSFIQNIKKSFAENNYNRLIITEKDYVKIKQLSRFDLPYCVLQVKLELINDEDKTTFLNLFQ